MGEGAYFRGSWRSALAMANLYARMTGRKMRVVGRRRADRWEYVTLPPDQGM